MNSKEFKESSKQGLIKLHQFYLVQGTIERFFAEDETSDPGFSMSDELFCSLSSTDIDSHDLVKKMILSKEPCHVYGVAFSTADHNVYRLSPLIMQSEHRFLDRWEIKTHEIKSEFAHFLTIYHKVLSKKELNSCNYLF